MWWACLGCHGCCWCHGVNGVTGVTGTLGATGVWGVSGIGGATGILSSWCLWHLRCCCCLECHWCLGCQGSRWCRVSGATNAAGTERAAGVTGAAAVAGVVGAACVPGSQVPLLSQVLRERPVSQDLRSRCCRRRCGCRGYCSSHRCRLCRGRLKGHTRGLGLGYLPSLPGWVQGGGLGLVVFSCESWVVPCLEWSSTGIGRPVAGWMAQGLETGVLSC